MGTNYYIVPKPPCDCCNRPYERIHIGKSSIGWKFNFRGYDSQSWEVEEGLLPNAILSFEDWKLFLKDKQVVDEYGNKVDQKELFEFIEGKQEYTSHSDKYPSSQNYQDKGGYEFSLTEFS